jgi:hypothetical protein
MTQATPPPELPPRRPRTTFRPSFTLMLLYLAGFFVLFSLLFALPDLIEGAQQLPPGPDELTDEELAQAREISRQALSGGKIFAAIAASVIAVGLGAFRGVLPGLGER